MVSAAAQDATRVRDGTLESRIVEVRLCRCGGGRAGPLHPAGRAPAALPAALWGLRAELLGPGACAPSAGAVAQGRARAVVGGAPRRAGRGARGSALQQEGVIQTMGSATTTPCTACTRRHAGHAYLPLTSHILDAFVNSQVQGHRVGPPQLPVQAGGRPFQERQQRP